jgi:hypothetical protein
MNRLQTIAIFLALTFSSAAASFGGQPQDYSQNPAQSEKALKENQSSPGSPTMNQSGKPTQSDAARNQENSKTEADKYATTPDTAQSGKPTQSDAERNQSEIRSQTGQQGSTR